MGTLRKRKGKEMLFRVKIEYLKYTVSLLYVDEEKILLSDKYISELGGG